MLFYRIDKIYKIWSITNRERLFVLTSWLLFWKIRENYELTLTHTHREYLRTDKLMELILNECKLSHQPNTMVHFNHFNSIVCLSASIKNDASSVEKFTENINWNTTITINTPNHHTFEAGAQNSKTIHIIISISIWRTAKIICFAHCTVLVGVYLIGSLLGSGRAPVNEDRKKRTTKNVISNYKEINVVSSFFSLRLLWRRRKKKWQKTEINVMIN